MSRTPLEIIDGAIRVIQSQSKTSGDGADHQADALRKARAAVAELIEAAQSVMGVADNADFVSDVCCCGSRMDRHTHGENHAPTDSGTYYGNMALDRLRAALARVGGA